ncbi:MFS transporter (plasmid) [Rhizobium grahamii]|uniref:MFS transporter n=1 Tax=Rhizobium grahamii TaxID=1120045 RepID=A0A5Q0CHL9_9HYPH|nr:MFS transporter [Rhizobium grahamii]
MLGIVGAGGALVFYDFVIFAFLADLIALVFFPPGLPNWLIAVQTFGIFAAGYIFRPLGGVVLAHFGDIFGRKRVFAFSILLMAFSTLAIGLLPGYQTVGLISPLILVGLRMLQGIAIGGEVPGAWTFAAEHVSQRRVGAACGFICAWLGLGVFFGASITAMMSWLLSPENMLTFGWRVPFLVGGALGLLAVRLRQMLQETPVFVSLRERNMLVPELPLKVVIKRHCRGIVISVLCTWILSATVVLLLLMVPTILQRVYALDHQIALVAASISTISLVISVILAGFVLDRIGVGRFFILGGLLMLVGDLAFINMTGVTSGTVYLLASCIGMSGAITTGVPVVMVLCFPPEVRFSGISFSYNVAYAVFGGITPVALAVLLGVQPHFHTYYLLFISLLSVGLGLYFLVTGSFVEQSE